MDSVDVEREVRRLEDSGDVRGVLAFSTISQYCDDVDVQAACLRVLGNVCCDDDENRRVAGRCGAIEAVVGRHEASRRKRESPGVRVPGAYIHVH